MNEIYIHKTVNKTEIEINVWCAFPAVYNFGMASLGFLKVFQLINNLDFVLAERIFTDTKTTYIQFKNIDLITFALNFELNYTGILQILEKYKIPFLAKEREEKHPLIFGGGAVLSANPEPFAEFFDFILIGDAENVIEKILDVLKQYKNAPKLEKLKKLSLLEGIYVPTLKTENYNVKKAAYSLNDCTSTPILSDNSFFPNTFIIEVERGCPNKCLFCLTSYINNPVRFCPLEKIIEQIDMGLKYTNKIALLGASICSHPKIDDICDYIINKVNGGLNIELSVSSLRADKVSDKMLKMLRLCGQNSATIAIEAGSERLRNFINKNLKQEDILNFVDKMVLHGFSGLKIYGIVGLPTETYDDLDEFISLCANIKQKYKGFNIVPSFSTFVPKAQTPFQTEKRENTKSLEKKIEYLKKKFAILGIKARLSSAKWDWVQAILSRGSRALNPYLIEVYQNGASLGTFKNIYKQYEEKMLLPPSSVLALDEQQSQNNLPWNFIYLR